MKARGLLMIEHRLIEKMLVLADTNVQRMNENNYNPLLVDSIVDFIKMYADRTHHGKEEDILFKSLEKKNLSHADRTDMNGLVDDHKKARQKVAELIDLNKEYKKGNRGAVSGIKEIIGWLGAFYPVHIEKEDKVFFPNADAYFTKAELDEILEEYYAFDAKMIHEKYNRVYAELTVLSP